MSRDTDKQKVAIVGAGPVGALAALYAAARGDIVEVYELRAGILSTCGQLLLHIASGFYWFLFFLP